MSLLEIHNLTKFFGGLKAVDHLSFQVGKGEIVGIIGPNGSGKTTVFNLISGFHRPTAGDIRFESTKQPESLVGLLPYQITTRGIARTFQNQHLFNNMTVLENVYVGMHCRTQSGILGAALRTRKTRQEQRAVQEKAYALLQIFGTRLTSMANALAYTLSYANRRRLEIARALATEPLLLLLDEPAAGMNPSETRELMNDIRRIRDQGITILLIEHDMSLVKGICERVIAMDHGEKITEGPFEAVRHNPRVIEAYLGRRESSA